MRNISMRGLELIGAVVVFFLLLLVYTKVFGPIPFTVNNINTLNSTPFEVTGNGKASAAPDTAVVNLGVTESGTTVAEAQAKTNKSAENIINGLKELGIEEKDIKTINYSVRPNYSNRLPSEIDSEQITGYTVTQNFEVKAPIDKANEVVDSATSNGANLVGGIAFTLDDEKMEELKDTARKEAVDMAKRSAEGLANAAGIKLGNIINVQENYGGGPVPMYREAVAIDSAVGEEVPPTNITPGETNVEVTVTLTYQTL
jgi:uncharacterized protein YggE